MKHLSLFSIVFILLCSCQSKDNIIDEPEVNTNDINLKEYDSIKAAKYGADDYGMKTYVMAFLKRGSNDSIQPEEASKLQNEHLKNIMKMAEEGKLVLAGPFMDNGELRGIYIFNVETIQEAEELTNTDPSIQAGVLAMELKQWYGSAALMAVNDIHNTLSKQAIAE